MKFSSKDPIRSREDEGQVVHIHDVNNEPLFDGEGEMRTPVTITVAGTYSAVYRKTLAAQKERLVKGGRRNVTAEALDRRQVELVAACILAWTPMEWDEKPFPCTRENAITLLEAYPYIREQLEAAMGDHEGFFTKSSAS